METDLVQTRDRETELIFDVFVADPLVIDQYVYRCWLQGLDGILSHNTFLFYKTFLIFGDPHHIHMLFRS